MRRSLLLSTVAAVGFFASVVAAPAFADEAPGQPAVSQMDFKFDAGGGAVDHHDVGYAQGTVGVPLGHDFGFQVDGTLGDWRSKAFEAVNGHLFWRDPSKGLVGLFVEYLNTNVPTTITSPASDGSSTLERGAFEGELYLDRVSVEGRLGVEGGTIGQHAYDRVILAYYPSDDFRMSLGQFTEAGQGFGDLAFEYQPSEKLGAILFADAFTSHDVVSGTVGIRFYFGAGSKSLIAHAREDDPTVDVPQDLIGIAHAQKHAPACRNFEGALIPNIRSICRSF